MPTKLKGMRLTSVDLVRSGANQEADIMLRKSANEEPEKDTPTPEELMSQYKEALKISVGSILSDQSVEMPEKIRMLEETMQQFRDAVESVPVGQKADGGPKNESEDEDEAEDENEDEPEYEEVGRIGRYDEIEDGSRYEEIVEVSKFNPFHDALGRFATSRGFKTYSANPKSKAGAAAIHRSAAGGHGSTINSHKESQGENIRQNENWLNGGKGAKWLSAHNYLPGQTNPQKGKKKQTKQTDSQNQPHGSDPMADVSIQSSIKGVKVSKSLAEAADPTVGSHGKTHATDVAKDRNAGYVQGSVLKNFDVSKRKGMDPIDAVAKAQGWDKQGMNVTHDLKSFHALCEANNTICFRSTDDFGDFSTPEKAAGATIERGDLKLGGSDGKMYGSGMYMVCGTVKGKTTDAIREAKQNSFCYGNSQIMATFRPGAKVADHKKTAVLTKQFEALPKKTKAEFGNDRNAWIAAQGYDAVIWHDGAYDNAPYSTIFNKSALIAYGEVTQA